jgi:hypothetical protein
MDIAKKIKEYEAMQITDKEYLDKIQAEGNAVLNRINQRTGAITALKDLIINDKKMDEEKLEPVDENPVEEPVEEMPVEETPEETA